MRPPTDKELRLLFLRLSRKLPEKLKLLESDDPRNIKLGLERVKRAVPRDQSWQGVHVAGTNGKGSICAYLSGLFTLAGKSHGRYTSPAFPEKRHGVVINGEAVRQSMYDNERMAVLRQYERVLRGFEVTSNSKPGPLTPFEIDTATAFRIFNLLKVSYGIVEVGMGGGTDATNVMKNKAVTVISKIGIDHAEYLGKTLREIASVKAGIMIRGVPCIVDHTNEPEVMDVLEHHASQKASPLVLSSKGQSLLSGLDNDRWRLEDWQQQNLLCAVTAFHTLFPDAPIDPNELMDTNPSLPGRMQTVRISPSNQGGREMTALVDGAHNPLATEKLARYVDRNLRTKGGAVTWIIGFSYSDTKPFRQMLQAILRPQDNVAFVEFAQQVNEPAPVAATFGRQWALDCLDQTDSAQVAPSGLSLEEALNWARQRSGDGGPVVVTGSLYLIRDLLKLPNVDGKALGPQTRRIGSTIYKALRTKKSKEGLTDEEMKQYLSVHNIFTARDRERRQAKKNRDKAPPSNVETTQAQSEKSPKTSTATNDISGEVVKDVTNSGAESGTFPKEEDISQKGAAEEDTPQRDQGQRDTKKPKRVLYTPFWRDPENPSMSLPDPSGKPSRRSVNAAARSVKQKKLFEEREKLEQLGFLKPRDGDQLDTPPPIEVEEQAVAEREKDAILAEEEEAERWSKIANRRKKQ